MKRRKLVVGGTVAGAIVAVATAASKAWTAASKELWRLDDDLPDDGEIPPEKRPFLAKLTGQEPAPGSRA
ncbi:MAG: hypothetical protein ABR518_04105 [Actinomycetota bacterium]